MRRNVCTPDFRDCFWVVMTLSLRALNRVTFLIHTQNMCTHLPLRHSHPPLPTKVMQWIRDTKMHVKKRIAHPTLKFKARLIRAPHHGGGGSAVSDDEESKNKKRKHKLEKPREKKINPAFQLQEQSSSITSMLDNLMAFGAEPAVASSRAPADSAIRDCTPICQRWKCCCR
jgi:hypothetical protein